MLILLIPYVNVTIICHLSVTTMTTCQILKKKREVQARVRARRIASILWPLEITRIPIRSTRMAVPKRF